MEKLKLLEEYSKISNELKENMLYNLSKSSKELFHSDFICWLINKYPTALRRMFERVLDKELKDFSICQREKDRLDLSICGINNDPNFNPNSNMLLVIENKVKSYPYKNQLIKYNKTLEKELNVEKILLTLFNPTQKDSIEGWTVVEYKTLFNKNNCKELLESATQNDQYIINQYLDFWNNMQLIIKYVNMNDSFALFDRDNKIFTTLNDIGLGYNYIKICYLDLSFKVFESLKKSSDVTSAILTESWLVEKGAFNVSSWFTNRSNQPLVDINYCIENKSKSRGFGVQLQERGFKLYSNTSQGQIELPLNVLKELLKTIQENNSDLFDETVRNIGQRESSKSNNTYKYVKLNLRSDITVEQVTNLMVSSMLLLYNDYIANNYKREKIQPIIGKISTDN